MEFDWITFGINLLGTGVVVGLISLAFDWHQNKVQRDFEARREAKDYYLPLYGHIAKVDEFASAYIGSVDDGKARVFNFKKHEYSELSSEEILDNFKSCYYDFSKFYIEKKSEGYELFINDKMKERLMAFWCEAQLFVDCTDGLKDSKKVKKFHKLADELTDVMEELFGLT